MKYIKAVGAFLIGAAVLLLCYQYVRIPAVPCIAVWLGGMLFAEEPCFLRYLSVIVLSLAGAWLFGVSAYMTFVHYPAYGNYLAVGVDALDALLFLGAGYTLLHGMRQD